MALTQVQQELIGAISAIEARSTPFWNLFKKNKVPYMALSTTIRVDEVMEHLVKAKLVPRGTVLQPIEVGGFSTVTIKPDILSASVGVSAEDTILQQPGELAIVNGQKMKASTYDRVLKLTTIKSAIEGSKEDMAASVFLTGKTKDASGVEVNLGLKEPNAVNKEKTESWLSFFRKQVSDYKKKHNTLPDRIFVGTDIADSLAAYIESSNNPLLGVQVKLEDGQIKYELKNFPITIETYPDSDTETDTSKSMTLFKELCLFPVYAGLSYVGTTGKPEMIRSDVVVIETKANEETGQQKLGATSAPFPLIVRPDLFERYTVTIK